MAIRFFSKEKDPHLACFYIKNIETMKCGSLLFSVTFINLSIMLTSNESGVNTFFSHFRHFLFFSTYKPLLREKAVFHSLSPFVCTRHKAKLGTDRFYAQTDPLSA